MAHILGIAGDYQNERAIKRRERVLIAAVAFFGILEFACGFFVAHGKFVVFAIGVLVLILAMRRFGRYFDQQLRRVRIDDTGAEGERAIIPFLKKLPDTYTVICDLDFADSYGNIDHLVIGPTGIFSIDVKNWKGTVAADGRGELLLNGHPTDKPQVRNFTRRTMDLKERLKALTRLDPYIQCLFVFPHTYLEARWGTTGAVLCVDTDNLLSIITKPNPAHAIPPTDIPRLIETVRTLKNLANATPAEQDQHCNHQTP